MTPGRAARPSCYITAFPIWCRLRLGWPCLFGVAVFVWGARTPQCCEPRATRHRPLTLTGPPQPGLPNPEPHPSLLLTPLPLWPPRPLLLDLCPPGSTHLSPAPQNTALLTEGTPSLSRTQLQTTPLPSPSTHGCLRAASSPGAALSSSDLP